jgi:hypothetical protein
MGVEQEELARAFILEFECERVDPARTQAVVDRMAPDACYHVFAWEEPFVGREAIRYELLRQAASYRDGRFEILNVASAGQVVIERIDWVTMNDKRAGFTSWVSSRSMTTARSRAGVTNILKSLRVFASDIAVAQA